MSSTLKGVVTLKRAAGMAMCAMRDAKNEPGSMISQAVRGLIDIAQVENEGMLGPEMARALDMKRHHLEQRLMLAGYMMDRVGG